MNGFVVFNMFYMNGFVMEQLLYPTSPPTIDPIVSTAVYDEDEGGNDEKVMVELQILIYVFCGILACLYGICCIYCICFKKEVDVDNLRKRQSKVIYVIAKPDEQDEHQEQRRKSPRIPRRWIAKQPRAEMPQIDIE